MSKIYLKKISTNKYELKIEKESLILFDETIINFNLISKENITLKEKEEIKEYDKIISIYYKILRWIKFKKRCEKEIIEKLTIEKSDKKSIDIVMNKLYSLNLINDRDYIKSYIYDQINLTLNGYNKIKKDLLLLDLNEEDIINYLNEIENEIWLNKIKKIIEKKIKSNHNLSKKALKEKIEKDLFVLGYDKDLYINILNNFDFKENNNILLKEYEKQKNKFIKKNVKNIDFYIKYELLKKGFTEEEINGVIH